MRIIHMQKMTVGSLYGAGPETLILVADAVGKKLVPRVKKHKTSKRARNPENMKIGQK